MERSCSRARSVSSCFCWSLRRWRFGIFFFGRWLSDLDSLAFSGVFTLEVVDIGFLIGDVGGVVNVRRQNAVAVAFVSSSFSLSSFSSSPPRNSTTTPPLCSSFRPASEVDKMSIGIFFCALSSREIGIPTLRDSCAVREYRHHVFVLRRPLLVFFSPERKVGTQIPILSFSTATTTTTPFLSDRYLCAPRRRAIVHKHLARVSRRRDRVHVDPASSVRP